MKINIKWINKTTKLIENTCCKNFNKVLAGKYEYSNWREKAKESLPNDTQEIRNIKKRVELNIIYMQGKNKSVSLWEFIAQISIILCALVTLSWNYAEDIVNTFEGQKNLIRDIISTYLSNTYLLNVRTLFDIFLLFLFCHTFTQHITKKERIKLCCYKELLNILDELEKSNLSSVYYNEDNN